MFFKSLTLVFSVLSLAGCASSPVKPLAGSQLWQDVAFHYQPQAVAETRQTLFELDASLEVTLKASIRQPQGVERRLRLLLDHLYGAQGIRLDYQSGHSTGASQTWKNQRGDCLSLTLLTYAATQALGIPAQMQEVRVPVAIDRRGGIDFISGHVNVFIPNSSAVLINGRSFDAGGLVIDFEPQTGSRQRGTVLTPDQIAARFYNNRAAEYLLAQDFDTSYAYYKAAIQADPEFSSAYANLALLYSRRGLDAQAEQLLRHALALNDDTDAPLRALYHLLQAQGRDEETRQIARQLERHQHQDPYYWLGVGLDALNRERYVAAIDALKRAEELASGFAEIHRYLAYAYWRNDQSSAAKRQLAVLSSLDSGDPGVAVLQKKFSGAALVQ
jgi:Flp pilus assembly protein TadD